MPILKPKDKCPFDHDGACFANACYSSHECNSRDKEKNPLYTTRLEQKAIIKKESSHD